MSIQTPLGRVRGLGSAKSGVEHFWHQRLTAAALVPLTVWFVWIVARYAGAPHADVVTVLGHPINAALMLLFVVAGLYHMALGLQVVIEDYITTKGMKIAALFLVNFAAFAIAMICAVAVLRIAIRF
ncbi:MAG: succinate dehydrogenase, hydrophobic membrane anchor protein [Alphaproteobacteria bacterium]|jgi:succinate dehydrogenase / fumarate reductase membrane anchor subunit|nr:succinate dehydrogenase, hydrophobic membrane anchor protein [Alphaproteobacteria bacterium]